MPQMLTLELPDSIYKRFKWRAEATEQSVEEVIMKTLSASLPAVIQPFSLPVRFYISGTSEIKKKVAKPA